MNITTKIALGLGGAALVAAGAAAVVYFGEGDAVITNDNPSTDTPVDDAVTPEATTAETPAS